MMPMFNRQSLSPRNWSLITRGLVIASVSSLLFLLGALIFLRAPYQTIEHLKQQESELKYRFARKYQQYVDAKQIAKLNHLLKQRYATQLRRINKKRSLSVLLSVLVRTVQSQSLQLISISPLKKSKKLKLPSGLMAQPIKLEISGHFSEWFRFLHQLSSLPWLISIKQLTVIGMNHHQSSQKGLKIQTELEVYYR